ncbi:K+-transporting ATPase subunit C [Niabella ginsenosidivorans]|uniref:Potassium-transporting ATPase KdpC subunit n=1 Tax=Niabella ginsenosidivorans TaxID=1176587 RepID=A0A1A9I272_9BACT|nr:K(+)-transporting ATPase subunit C [Niabella ginsenosidivorans]ANH80810.1 K+-transporting ATPase subunit C [Niabella ginsenosidivorans]
MKKYIFPSLMLTLIFIILCAVLYPLLIAGVGRLTPGGGDGEKLSVNGKVVGYANIGQKFTADNYFWSRPSAVNYNAAGSAGSNKGPSNPHYLKEVQAKTDTFLAHNPGVEKTAIPAELVTSSGSGLDPDLSPAAAFIQVPRVARARNLPESRVQMLVQAHIQKPLLGLFGPAKVNVLKLNIALDNIK